MEGIPGLIEQFIVLSTWLEEAYRGDVLSTKRWGYSFTLHDEEREAEERLKHELMFCLLPSQRKSCRRSVILGISIPERVVSVDGNGHRWCSDRIPELAKRAKIHEEPNPVLAITAAFETPKPHLFLSAALEAAEMGMKPEICLLLQGVATMPESQIASMRPVVFALISQEESS